MSFLSKRAEKIEKHTDTKPVARTPKTITFTLPVIPKPQIRMHPKAKLGAGLLAVILLVSMVSGFGGALLQQRYYGQTIIGGSLSNQKKIVTSQSQLISQIAKTLGPSVVSVNVELTTTSSNNFDFFGGPPQTQRARAAGTGFIISANGLIVTNRHVAPLGTTSVSITLSDGTELKDVSVVGRTSENDSLDVAFLKVNDLKGYTLIPAVIGDSLSGQVGDDVVAIGNALGQFQNTVTSGIISGFGRSVQASSSADGSSSESLDNLIQTDAAINEGNSGGPLVNLNGQVIGINTAIAGNAQNIGFAIPINDLKGLINQVLKTGKFERAYLGIHYIPLTPAVAENYKLSVTNGAYIAPSGNPNVPAILPDSPASKAGLEEKDIITEVDGSKIDKSHSLSSLLNMHSVGDKITLTVLRDDKTVSIEATLEAVPTNL